MREAGASPGLRSPEPSSGARPKSITAQTPGRKIMQISKYMKTNVVSVAADATIRDAAQILVKQHVGMLPVVDKAGKPVGLVGLQEMLTLELPDVVNFVADVDFVH